MAVKKMGLGRGLEALMGVSEPVTTPVKKEEKPVEKTPENGVVELKIALVEPNREQPRKQFDEEKLQILADSIKTHGVIQPILVKEREKGYYMIIAGERRWRAAKLAGLKTIPAVVKNLEEQKVMEVALVENLQREDLNPIDTAKGYQFLAEKFNLTQEEISARVGKSRSAIANTLRLLTLPEFVQDKLFDGALTEGHARSLIGLSEKDALAIAEKIIADGLSVRATEELIRRLKKPTTQKTSPEKNVHHRAVEKNLSKKFGTKVQLLLGAKKGKIVIEYYDDDQLNQILEKMGD
ncbi:MAG: ParB/RepB/Spo0J family partition protein [Clostridia bacterium]|nr:ParB/RepB/Spo0J family partition protein [Clostridia bacterium]